MQLRRVVAIFLFFEKRRPVIGRVRLANEKVAKEEADNPNNNEADHSVYDAFEGVAFALGEDAFVEEHEAELDQAQTRNLHQLDRPQDLAACQRSKSPIDGIEHSHLSSRLLLI